MGDRRFLAESGGGHIVQMDCLPKAGGRSEGASPMELVLAGLAGCAGIDALDILEKMRQNVSAYEIRVSGERADEPPRVYTRVVVEHWLAGDNLDFAKVERALALSREKYCSVLHSLRKDLTLSTRLIFS